MNVSHPKQLTRKCCYSQQLTLQIKELEAQRSAVDNQLTSQQKQQQTQDEHWKRQLRLAEEDKQRLLKDKDSLLAEVSHCDAVVADGGERWSRCRCWWR